jgi:hypothetical protein
MPIGEVLGFRWVELLLFGLPIALGVFLIYLSRFARKKNSDLNDSLRHRTGLADAWQAYVNGEFGKALKIYFVGTTPEFIGKLATILAGVVILAIAALFVFVAWHLL